MVTATGMVTVVGTEATNEKRFEPNIKGTFVRVNMATVDPVALTKTIVDLNGHLTYATGTIPQADRDVSLGDQRGIVDPAKQRLARPFSHAQCQRFALDRHQQSSCPPHDPAQRPQQQGGDRKAEPGQP